MFTASMLARLASLASLVAVTALLAVIATVLDTRMVAWILLANDWQMRRAAAGNVDGTARGSRSRAQHEAGSLVLVAVPVVNPGLAVGAGALEGQGGGLHKVVNINVGQVHSEGVADGLGLAAGDVRVHYNEVVALVVADIQDRVVVVVVMVVMVVVMVMMVVMIVVSVMSMVAARVNADGTNTTAVWRLQNDNGDVVPAW